MPNLRIILGLDPDLESNLSVPHRVHTRFISTFTAGEVYHALRGPRRPGIFFETMSKRRRGFPSETKVKRGVQIVHGDKLLEEKLGCNDFCPCGSGKLFKRCCMKSGRF